MHAMAIQDTQIKNDRGGTSVATGGSIGLSAFSSFVGLCCIGPWSVALFGITGAVALARWQPYRPLILAVAAILLAWGFWQVYRPKKACDGKACAANPPIWLKVALWSSAAFLALAFFAEELQWILVDPTPPALREQ